MYVRVYNKHSKKYFKSIVYGIINTGYFEQAIVVNPYSNCFELVDYLDKTTPELFTLYELINNNRDEWVTFEKAFLLKFKNYCKEKNFGIDIKYYSGYKEIYDNFQFMFLLIKDKSISLSDTKIEIRTNSDINDWNYIRTQSDADEFMKLFVGFHDSTLDYLSYEEEYGKKQLKVCFDNSRWYGVVELCFEGLVALNLRSYVENCTREIYAATLIIKDECVFWADDELEKEDFRYCGTFIKALNLKWKKVE